MGHGGAERLTAGRRCNALTVASRGLESSSLADAATSPHLRAKGFVHSAPARRQRERAAHMQRLAAGMPTHPAAEAQGTGSRARELGSAASPAGAAGTGLSQALGGAPAHLPAHLPRDAAPRKEALLWQDGRGCLLGGAQEAFVPADGVAHGGGHLEIV